MSKERLLAYTDAVIAIIITIMVLELKAPHDVSWNALFHLKHEFIAYVLSFLYTTIYRNNHHHLFQTVEKIKGSMLWANSILLFCLSLIPFATTWMATNHFAANTIVFYGIILFLTAFAYVNLEIHLSHVQGRSSLFTLILRRSNKEKLSLLLYLIGIGVSFIHPYGALACYYLVALIWFIPDKRIEKMLS